MTEQLTTPAPESSSRKLGLEMTVAALARLLLNTSRRFAYPFAPALARGLGVPLVSITSLIALNQLTGILSPLFGPVSDRWGYRTMMLLGLGIMSIGMLAGGFLPFYLTILIALFLAGLGKNIFDPALQAYIGERVPFKRRGMVVGLIEMSWAGATLIGIPAIGLLIERFSWRAPFLVMGGLGLVSLAMLGVLFSGGSRRSQRSAGAITFGQAWRQLSGSPAVLGMLAFGFLTSMANDNLFVVYGAWLEDQFALRVVALGTATTVIGVAELSGEVVTASLSDRIGLQRAVRIGLLLSALGYLLLPVMAQSLTLALVGLFLVFVIFEFTFVTAISLVTEILPEARATMMASYIAVAGVGRVVGALIGGPLWVWGGLTAIGTVSAAIVLLAFVVFWRRVRI
ncbi:MAG: MFS transporter [Anaerolineales bacterium]|nr:MFS transporter [Anaerolineales bacterium]